MSRILILFASHYGQTRAIALRMAERLRGRDHEVDVIDACDGPRKLPDPQDYDAVIIGSRVELGRHAPQIRKYLRAHAAALRGVPTAFFSVNMAAAEPSKGDDPDDYRKNLFREVSWEPTRSISFAGGLPYRKYGPITRFIMKRISARAGHPTDTDRNHDLTRWDDVERFADELATLLAGEVAPSPPRRPEAAPHREL